MPKNPYILRCYARPEGDHLIAVCVDLDIMVRGATIDEVRQELTDAIKSYLGSLDKENIKDLFPRRAPAQVMANYYFVVIVVHCMKFFKSVKSGFDIFCELATPQGFKVSPCA